VPTPLPSTILPTESAKPPRICSPLIAGGTDRAFGSVTNFPWKQVALPAAERVAG
jgi:hypothetical protein